MEENMENIKAAIFDLDGTIIDSMYVWAKVDEDFLTQRGIEVTPEYTDKMRTMFFETAAAYTRETYHLDETVEEIMQVWLDMAHYEYANNVRAKDGAREYIRSLKKKGIKIGMATSNNPYLLKPCLENNGMLGLFDIICYTSEVGMNKSNPDIYLYTAEKLGAKPEECIVFEDIPEGIKSAGSVGMKTAAVYDPSNEQYVGILKESSDFFVVSYREIIDEAAK